MSGLSIFLGLTLIYGLICRNEGTPTKDKSKYWEQYKKYNNMTDFDMREKMRDWFLWEDYKDCSREYKIGKLIEKENQRC